MAAFTHSLDRGPRWHRMALRAVLAVIAVVLTTTGGRDIGVLGRLTAALPAGIGEGLAALGQLAYYGEPSVLAALGYRSLPMRP